MGIIVFAGRVYGIIFDRAIEAIHEELDEVVFMAAWEEGQRMALDEAVEYVLGGGTLNPALIGT